MKKSIIFVFALIFTNLLFAEDLSGYDIMKKSEDLDCSKTSVAKATMSITNKKGSTRVREVQMKEKDYGDISKSVIVFSTPKDVAGVAYLSYSYEKKADGSKKDNDNWLYMPAMKKTRRISGSESDGDFMGTDFTYDDMGDRDLDEDDYLLMGTEKVDEEDCYKVKATSKDTSVKEPVRICYIGKSDFMVRKVEYFDRQEKLHRVLTCEGIVQIGGYWTCKKMTMKNVQTSHFTVLERSGIAFDEPIDDKIFTVSAIESGMLR
ncbi:MAG: outer membrane lipoprotein-sorting protein [Treponema sp.]|nr:outer membrane lipoprotein-sorting protein [Treponema sp.]